LTNVTHGALGYSIDGTDAEASHHHQVASPDPEGHAGFLSTAHANNLQYYTGATAPASAGTFGIDSAGLSWWEAAATAPGRDAAPRYAARRADQVVINGPGETWHASDGEVITIAGGAGNDVILPSGDARTVTISCDVGGTASVATTGGDTIMGLASPILIGSLGAEAWLLIRDANANWLRFVAA